MKGFALERVINSIVNSGHMEIDLESLHTGSGFPKLPILLFFATIVFFLSGGGNKQVPPLEATLDLSCYGDYKY